MHKRIIVVDVSEANDQPHTLINPVLETHGKKSRVRKAAFPYPRFTSRLNEFEYVNVTAQGVDGSPIEFTADGMLSICIQHECDHLEGKLFVDYLSSLKRGRIAKNCVNESARLADQPNKLRLAFARSRLRRPNSQRAPRFFHTV